MLSLSVQNKGEEVDLSGVVKGAAEVDERILAGKVLARFAEAVVLGTDADVEAVRSDVIEAVGPEGFVDAAGVIGNFERMVRIADGSGIPLDEMGMSMSSEIRQELGLNSFPTAVNTLGPKQP